ncbi:MAG TPA: hypothetical protein VJ650_02300 [Gemmatimonadaceae bacterium]|nr:hypothetical protein [Gemmatimonadaceae bacterium]
MATRPHDIGPPPAPRERTSEAAPTQLASLWANHPGLLLTTAYLIITAIGLVYDARLYGEFRINIAEYAETSDFLLAAARAPLIILLSLLPIPLLLVVGWFDRWSRRRFPRYAAISRRSEQAMGGERRARLLSRGLFVVIYAVMFTMLYAERVADDIKQGRGRRVEVQLVDGTSGPGELPILLGTTAKFVFLYYPTVRRTHVVPSENIARIVVNSVGRDDPAPAAARPAP